MKRIVLILVLCLVLSPVCHAESTNSDDFLSGLSQSWNALLGMASDAGQTVSDWADESGVTEWAEGAVEDVAGWLDESGVTEWAEGAVEDISAWMEDSGITEWAQETLQSFTSWAEAGLANLSENIQGFIEENGPAVEAWLAQAGEDVKQAWDTLVNADQHTEEEVQEAYDTVVESLEDSSLEQ